MQTILNIKTQKDLKEEAQSLASELGVPLTTVVNSYLRQFIRERKLVLEMEPKVKNSLMEKWHKISLEADIIIPTKHFKKKVSKLPKSIKIKLSEKIQLFMDEPKKVILNNHTLHGKYNGYRSINITGNYRII